MKRRARAENQAIYEILDMQSSGIVWRDKKANHIPDEYIGSAREALLDEEYATDKENLRGINPALRLTRLPTTNGLRNNLHRGEPGKTV
jgi:hypothetical protein